METLAEASCDNGICAIACAIACLLTGGADVAFGALGGIIGAWAGSAELEAA
jgi:hypothetical protein